MAPSDAPAQSVNNNRPGTSEEDADDEPAYEGPASYDEPAYDDAPPAERPKYGALNWRRRATGGSPPSPVGVGGRSAGVSEECTSGAVSLGPRSLSTSAT